MVDSGRIWKECHGWYGFLSKGLQSFEPDPTSHLMGPPFTIFQWFPVLCSGSDADLTAHVILASWCITHRFMRSSRKRPWFMDVYGLSMFILQLCLFGTLNLTRPKFTLAVDFSQSGNSMLVCLVSLKYFADSIRCQDYARHCPERERVISSRLITTAMWLCMYIIRCHALMKKCKNFGRSASLWLWKTGGQVAHWFACRMCERYWWWWSSYQLSTWWVNSNLVLRSARCVHRVALSRFAAGYLRPVRRTHGPPCHNVSKGFGPNGWAGEFRGCETQFCCLTVLTC